MIPIEQELGNEIASAVEQIVAASHAAATKAIDQAFHRRCEENSSRTNNGASKANAARGQAPRRTPEQLQGLMDSVYQMLCGTPGQTMAALAEQVGSIPVKLQVPMARLKAEGLVRSVGQRQSTRYFPKNNSPPVSS